MKWECSLYYILGIYSVAGENIWIIWTPTLLQDLISGGAKVFKCLQIGNIYKRFFSALVIWIDKIAVKFCHSWILFYIEVKSCRHSHMTFLFCHIILHHWMINQLTIEIEFDSSKCPYSRICITLILAATMSQCSNKPHSRMSISPRIRGMRSIFVISGQIFLKWILALLRTVSGNYPRLDTAFIEPMFSKSSFGLPMTQNPNQLITDLFRI